MGSRVDQSTLTLADFVLAQIAEREAKARAATPGPWRYNPNKVNALDDEESVFAGPSGRAAITVASTGPADDAPSMANAAHIALNDPAYVLTRCAADRQIVEYADMVTGMGDMIEGEWGPSSDPIDEGKRLLRLLALPYAGHPDYREEWKP